MVGSSHCQHARAVYIITIEASGKRSVEVKSEERTQCLSILELMTKLMVFEEEGIETCNRQYGTVCCANNITGTTE